MSEKNSEKGVGQNKFVYGSHGYDDDSQPPDPGITTSGIYEITTDKHGHIISAARKRLFQHQIKLSLYYSGKRVLRERMIPM